MDSNSSNNSIIIKPKTRNSNLELYRIIVMLLIVAHHYVVNSGLITEITSRTHSLSVSISMLLLGAWGKTGINCFVLITGYFMSKSQITWPKLLKLYLQIVFYAVIIYLVFCLTGHDDFKIQIALLKLFPIKNISFSFVSCFLLFYLFIPFLNKFISNISQKEHKLLIFLLLFIYSCLPTFGVAISFNYVEWFITVYVIASYIRFYSSEFKITHRQWGIITLFLLMTGCLSVGSLFYFSNIYPYYFIHDSNKFLSLAIAVSSFMWFKNIKLKNHPWINTIAATTFGVLLIHANSDTMRQWLWNETINCVGNFGPNFWYNLGYALLSILLIFFIFSLIDWLRSKYIEEKLLHAVKSILLKIKINISKNLSFN